MGVMLRACTVYLNKSFTQNSIQSYMAYFRTENVVINSL